MAKTNITIAKSVLYFSIAMLILGSMLRELVIHWHTIDPVEFRSNGRQSSVKCVKCRDVTKEQWCTDIQEQKEDESSTPQTKTLDPSPPRSYAVVPQLNSDGTALNTNSRAFPRPSVVFAGSPFSQANALNGLGELRQVFSGDSSGEMTTAWQATHRKLQQFGTLVWCKDANVNYIRTSSWPYLRHLIQHSHPPIAIIIGIVGGTKDSSSTRIQSSCCHCRRHDAFAKSNGNDKLDTLIQLQ